MDVQIYSIIGKIQEKAIALLVQKVTPAPGRGLFRNTSRFFSKAGQHHLVNYKQLIESPDHKDLPDLVIAVPNAQRFIMCNGNFSKLQ